MSHPKRARGRPRGSGKDDRPALEQVADLMVQDPSLRATTAMKRVLRTRADWGATDATLIRRWQRKLQVQREPLLIAARDRARPQRAATFEDLPSSTIGPEVIPSFFKQVEALRNSPLAKEMQALRNSPLAKEMQALRNSPLAKQMQALRNSPWMKQMQAIQGSPWVKQMEAIRNSPWARLDKIALALGQQNREATQLGRWLLASRI
jgi:hypothetical protein